MPLRGLSESDLRYVLQSAVLAPSADNRLPIRFRIDDAGIAVRFTGPSRPRPGGYRELLLLLSLGALAENAVIAASRIGKRLAVEAPAALRYGEPLLTLAPTDETVAPDPLLEQLARRHTNRRVVFRGPPLSAAERRAIEDASAVGSGCGLGWLNDPPARAFAVRRMTRAETERFRNPVLHEELFSAIRFDVGWSTSCADGLPPGALQVEAPARPLFALLRRWPVARFANRFGVHHVFGVRSCRLPCMLAPDLGAITVERLDARSLVKAGRSFQRVWLELTRLGRALQPLPAAALYALPEAAHEGVPEALQRHLNDSWDNRFDGRHPVMFFRTGTAKPPRIRTERLPLEQYLEERQSPVSG